MATRPVYWACAVTILAMGNIYFPNENRMSLIAKMAIAHAQYAVPVALLAMGDIHFPKEK